MHLMSPRNVLELIKCPVYSIIVCYSLNWQVEFLQDQRLVSLQFPDNRIVSNKKRKRANQNKRTTRSAREKQGGQNFAALLEEVRAASNIQEWIL